MRRRFVGLCVAFTTLAAVAAPAWSDGYYGGYDAPVSTRTYASPWVGFYIGAHLGGTWGGSTATGYNGVTLNDSWSYSPSGLVAGATLGYNWLAGPMLFGLEGDLGHLGLAGTGGYYVPGGYDASTTTDTNFYLTIRGRLGVLMNGWLLYATGGYIGADTEVSVLDACGFFCGTPIVGASNSSFRNGWTFGGGFETQIEGPWTAKVEYLYYDLGAISLTTPGSGGIPATTWNVDTDGQLVRAGINYRFNSFVFGQ